MKIKIIAILFSFSSLSAISQSKPSNGNQGLKDYYSNYFPIGVAVTPQALKSDEATLIVNQFNSLTAENAMKMALIHPEENRYYWKDADEIVAFAQVNNMKVRGHTLCWFKQTPQWMFTDENGNRVTKEVLLKRLKDHITEVVTRYKGKIYAWDVVNEAVADDNSVLLRDSPWFQICGEDFISKAFEYAHEADPQAQLFYNDYSVEKPGKRERIYRLLKKLRDAGVPIHGIGLQGHWSIAEPSEFDLRGAIQRFSSLGLKIQVTELDVSIYPWEKAPRQRAITDNDTFTTEAEQKQLAQYAMFFKVFRDYKNVITGVTFWNISDRHSWLDSFPVPGRKDYPLLFDQNLNPKKAYQEITKF